MQIYAEHNDGIIKTSEDFFKKYTSHFICKVCDCERGSWRLNRTAIYWSPNLMAISVVSFLFSKAAQPEVGFLCCILSPTGLQTNWLPVFTELYNCSIAHSISLEWHVCSLSSRNICSQVTLFRCISLWLYIGILTLSHIVSQARPRQWNMQLPRLWNGMFVHYQAEISVHRSLSSGASVYDCTLGF